MWILTLDVCGCFSVSMLFSGGGGVGWWFDLSSRLSQSDGATCCVFVLLLALGLFQQQSEGRRASVVKQSLLLSFILCRSRAGSCFSRLTLDSQLHTPSQRGEPVNLPSRRRTTKPAPPFFTILSFPVPSSYPWTQNPESSRVRALGRSRWIMKEFP